MALLKEQKEEIVKKFAQGKMDTGSSQVQVALLTSRIQQLTEHFKVHKKDVHGKRGLVNLVNRRRKLLDYLKSKDPQAYTSLIGELKLRK